MMQEEFLSRLTDEARERFTEGQYELIQYVYTWHPAIKSKDDIAAIYNLSYGYRLIKDMVSTAKQAEKLEHQMEACRKQRDEIQHRLNDLQHQLEQMAN